MRECAIPLRADDFQNASEAVDRAFEAAMVTHDVCLVVALALATEANVLTLKGQEAVRNVAQYAVEKAQEARDAADIASGMFRTARGQS